MEGRSDIRFQVLTSPLVCEKINFHKEKDGVSSAFGGMQYIPTYNAKTEPLPKSLAPFSFHLRPKGKKSFFLSAAAHLFA